VKTAINDGTNVTMKTKRIFFGSQNGCPLR